MKKLFAMLMFCLSCSLPSYAFDMTSMATNTAMTMMVIGALDSDEKKPVNASAKEIKESSKNKEAVTNAPDWLLYTFAGAIFTIFGVLVSILLYTFGSVIKEEYFSKKA